MITVRYLLSSNEAYKISLTGQLFDDRDTDFWGVLTDPTTPDGTDIRDTSTEPPGDLRELGFAKFVEVGTNNVRNATAVEITAFIAAETADQNLMDADRAAFLGDTDPEWRKLVKSILKGAVRENNIMAGKYNELRAELLAATSLSDLQTRIADNTSDAPTRTNQQAYDAIRTDVDPDE